MRLLLDEHYTHVIAEQLRERGHDTVAVAERDDLKGTDDVDLLTVAHQEQRAIVTNNVVDFARLVQQAAQEGRDHFGVLFTDDRSLPRSKSTIGDFVRALDELLVAHPANEALMNDVRWQP